MSRKHVANDTVKLDTIRNSIHRWESRARRAHTMLVKLGRQERYYEKKTASRQLHDNGVHGSAHAVAMEVMAEIKPPQPVSVADDLSVPPFLRRTETDKAVIAEIKAEIETRKKAKAKGRIATMKAKAAGDTRKMPLSGKAALAFINN